jgi:hypothetical protein
MFWGIIGMFAVGGISAELTTTTNTSRDIVAFIVWVVTYGIYALIVYIV